MFCSSESMEIFFPASGNDGDRACAKDRSSNDPLTLQAAAPRRCRRVAHDVVLRKSAYAMQV